MALSRATTGGIIHQGGRKLDLKDRSLGSEDVAALAKLLSASNQVEILSLYNVRLGSEVAVFSSLTATALRSDLAECSCDGMDMNIEDAVFLARALEFNDSLHTLNFTHNPIGEVGTAALAEVIKFNTTLRDVSLANTVLNAQGCALLADALIMNRTLQSLNLEKNRIGAAGADFLAGALGANETLRTLLLDGNAIGDAGASSISDALSAEGGARLERLSLANTGITEVGAAAIGLSLTDNLWMKRLVMAKLELNPQTLAGRPGDVEGERDGATGASSKGLQTIDLSGQALSATLDYPIVCRLAAGNPRLARLRLSRAGLCGVTAAGRGRRSLAGIQSLALTLEAAPPRLVVLDVALNFVDDVAAELIAKGLSKNSVLRNLSLKGNGISYKVMNALVSSLPSSIVDLDISNNPAMGERGGVAVGRFLADFARSANLRKLDVSMCNLRDKGLEHLAEGVEFAKGLEWLGVAGNLNDPGSSGAAGGTGEGKMALGRALMARGGARLQGLSMDLWSVTKGQKELKLVRLKGTVPCQLPSTADVCLLAGLLCSHEWLRHIWLDGNPIDEAGLSYLCHALLRNRRVESLSLRRCGLGERSGLLLLRFLNEKPGLEVDVADENPLEEELNKKLLAALRHAREMLSTRVETRRTIVHLLGDAGAGKSTLRETMGRGYFTSFFSTSVENAKDRGAEEPSDRTLGVTGSSLPLGAGSEDILVQDYGGLDNFRGVGALDASLSCPTSVYVVVVSLAVDKVDLKRQIKSWLRLLQTIGPSGGSVILLVGSRADQLGSVGQSYLQKVWDRAREDLSREELRAGLDASLPTFAGCLAMDCRKTGDSNVTRLKEAIAHADKLFGQEGEGWQVSPLHPAAVARVARWAEDGSILVRWNDFFHGVQQQLCPRASEWDCADLARSLAKEGRLVAKGLSREGERERGRGWVLLDPSFFLRDIVGGVLGAAGALGKAETIEGGGVVSAAHVCQAVSNGSRSVQPHTLVQALLDADMCAELIGEQATRLSAGQGEDEPQSPAGNIQRQATQERGDKYATSSPRSDVVQRSQHSSGGSVEAVLSKGDSGKVMSAAAARPSTVAGKAIAPPNSSASVSSGESWAALKKRLLVFPALLPAVRAPVGKGRAAGVRGTTGSGASGLSGEQWKQLCGDSEAFLCGRRVSIRSPMLLPGLFHTLQARVANRYPGRAHLRYQHIELSLEGLDATGGGVFATGGSAGGGDIGGGAAVNAVTVTAAVELIDSDVPGGDAIDVIVASEDRKACFLTLLGLRLVVEEVLSQAPSVAVEDMAIAQVSLRERALAWERLILPLAQLKQDQTEGKSDCSFGNNTPPEPITQIVWDGPEEFELDDAGRIVSKHSFKSSPAPGSPSLTPAGVSWKASPPTSNNNSNNNSKTHAVAAAAAVNPFAPEFSEQNRKNLTTRTKANPFAASPVEGEKSGSPSQAPLAAPASSSANPFASPPSLPPASDPSRDSVSTKGASVLSRVSIDGDSLRSSRGGDTRSDGVGDKDGGRDHEGHSGEERDGLARCPSDLYPPSADDHADLKPLEESTGVATDDEDEDDHAAEEAAESARNNASFSFDGDVFRDPRRLLGAHLRGKTHVFGKQRVELVLRRPGGLRLGVWRPPVDEREERERGKDKDKGKAASETTQQHLLSGDSPEVTRNQDSKRSQDSTPDDISREGGATPGDASEDGTDNVFAPMEASHVPSNPSSSVHDNDESESLSSTRPAVVEMVLDEEVVTCFSSLRTGGALGVVGCVVASVSREPFESTESAPKLLTFDEASGLLASNEYPLFVQLCRPPSLYTIEPDYPPVKLISSLVCTNRKVEKTGGQFSFGDTLAGDGGARWALATTAVSSNEGELGSGMIVDLTAYHVVGMYSLTQDEAAALLTNHPSQDVFLYVHGFNTPFDYGIRSTASKSRAFKKSLAVCLAWPSNPPGDGAGWLIKQVMSTYERRYTYCEHNMHATIFTFLQAALDIKTAADRGGKSLCWKGHSMGCYLFLNIVDRLRWKGEDMQAVFGRVILDAPDVPTWFFRAMTKVLAENGVPLCHYFNPGDNAIQASCTRRALQRPVPGQDAILDHRLMQGVLCDKARSSSGMNHDYGRTDGRCLLDQRDFLAGEPPDQRVLQEIVSAEGVVCWQLETSA